MQQWTRGNDSDWTSYIRIDQNDSDHMIGLDVLETRIIENILVGSALSVLMKEMGLSEVSRLLDERERILAIEE